MASWRWRFHGEICKRFVRETSCLRKLFLGAMSHAVSPIRCFYFLWHF